MDCSARCGAGFAICVRSPISCFSEKREDLIMTRSQRRLMRQFAALERKLPVLRGPNRALLGGRWSLLRIPLAILLILGGLLSVVPVFGLWMLPLGLLLLAVDVPAVQPIVTSAVIRARRRVSIWLRWIKS